MEVVGNESSTKGIKLIYDKIKNVMIEKGTEEGIEELEKLFEDDMEMKWKHKISKKLVKTFESIHEYDKMLKYLDEMIKIENTFGWRRKRNKMIEKFENLPDKTLDDILEIIKNNENQNKRCTRFEFVIRMKICINAMMKDNKGDAFYFLEELNKRYNAELDDESQNEMEEKIDSNDLLKFYGERLILALHVNDEYMIEHILNDILILNINVENPKYMAAISLAIGDRTMMEYDWRKSEKSFVDFCLYMEKDSNPFLEKKIPEAVSSSLLSAIFGNRKSPIIHSWPKYERYSEEYDQINILSKIFELYQSKQLDQSIYLLRSTDFSIFPNLAFQLTLKLLHSFILEEILIQKLKTSSSMLIEDFHESTQIEVQNISEHLDPILLRLGVCAKISKDKISFIPFEKFNKEII